MNTINKKNSYNTDLKNHFSDDRNLADDLKDDRRQTDNDNREIAERGYTVRNGYNPNRPNPDQEDYTGDDDLDDLNDDFHNDRDLEDNNDDIYEVELEDDNYAEENDEFDNPSDLKEDEYDFNETEDALEDIDDEEEDDDDDDDDDNYIEEDIDEGDNDYVEDDVQEDNDDEEYPENDPRRF
ncbi:hypothetical protein N4T20_13820 [Flavobacterium sp. TR2]|uniref:hypothetical protein n=1 Tax=Flavobacterium sp. TR2 TaxID=2977321 RepID=UPI0021B13FD7|nr:hypothetical protein [Flavobacterium sp. TR2]UWY26797.1 hypothetical protein N4T20_13820 [Flavobacterium sp. TR2]